MDALEKKLTEVISRASDALEEYDYMKENDTGDYSAVMENLEHVFEITDYLKEEV